MTKTYRSVNRSPEPAARANRSVEERLLRLGLKAFAEHGYAEVSVDAICDAARCTKPMLYYYFGSKAGLYRAVARQAFRAVGAPAPDDADPIERVRAFVRHEFRTMRDNPDLARFLYRTAYAASPRAPRLDHWALFLPSFTAVTEMVEAAQAARRIARGPAPRLALPLFGLLGIWVQVHLAGPLGDLLSDDEADRLVDTWLGGVSAAR
jgi:AcrR family transcriptional regulator